MIIPRERLEYVERLWLKGVSESAIQEMTSKRFGVTHRAVRRYMKRVKDRLAALPSMQPDAERKRVERLLLDAIRVARRGGRTGPHTSAMVAAITRLGQLTGLFRETIDHNVHSESDLSKLSPEELATMDALLRKASR